MRKLIILTLGTLLMLSSTFSCVSFTPHLNISKVFPRKSFLFVEKKTTFFQCAKLQCKIVFEGKMTGSASVIFHNKKKTFVLTAAHMVWMQAIHPIHKMMLERKGKLKSVDSWTLTDISGKKYKGIKVIKSDKSNDLAILSINRNNIPELAVSSEGPKIGDKLYNVGAPAGTFGKNMVPFYEGRFLGYWKDKRTGSPLPVMMTSIPVAGGSSGSPILNKYGHVVGMVSAVNRGFHHISISPTWKQLYDFVNKHLQKHGFNFCTIPDYGEISIQKNTEPVPSR